MNAMKKGKKRKILDGNSKFLKRKEEKMLGRGKEQEMKSVRT